ncbi:alpha-methylacyl-CoA racemase [Litorimonas taeanensis]|uniref:Alpha-methylacyl-CoA racemase n=1 Tax=Litorimonas taeanensis TaxID=568099 RepID=A0A420WLJ9_9PROT|nr:CaiB/BaiF CoA-transferase family protein [Litorimonas taeanensis]RKQ71897.1 alpha-methylacyl-CoA racemase [Litorimonas taeanensis]
MDAPLSGYRFIELAGIGPCPYAGQILVDMGAEVILVNNQAGMNFPNISHRGKKTITLDLRSSEGAAVLMDLVQTADGLYEGLRPGVAERLGVGPENCHAINPKLVYGRMTGWGQTGPWAKTAGHDINYISITGALGAMGKPNEAPPIPLNLIGDYGGGSLFLVSGLLAALLQAEKTGKGTVVDAAMIDGVSSMMTLFYTLSGLGQWTPKRESNLLDGSKPYYRCYETSDQKYMAVGCIEPQFFAEMLSRLDIDAEEFGGQNDTQAHAEQQARLEALFKSKTRQEWEDIFDGSDACVTPVLDYQEAAEHPQNKARGGFHQAGPFLHPRPAPIFNTPEPFTPPPILGLNDTAKDLLSELGYSNDKIENLASDKIIGPI